MAVYTGPAVDGTNGKDVLYGTNKNELLRGFEGDDELNAGGGSDVLRGQGGADTLNGQAGRDDIFGGPGDDIINGGGGADELFGGSGADTFVMTYENSLNYGNTGNPPSGFVVETIYDFETGIDTIRLEGFEGTNPTIRIVTKEDPNGVRTREAYVQKQTSEGVVEEFLFLDTTGTVVLSDFSSFNSRRHAAGCSSEARPSPLHLHGQNRLQPKAIQRGTSN